MEPVARGARSGGRGETAQLEAIPPDLLTRIVVDAIEALTDTDTRDEVLALEAEQRSALVARVNDMED